MLGYYFFVIILLIIVLLLLLYLIFIKKELKNINKQLLYIMNQSTNKHLIKCYLDHDTEQLIQIINKLIEQKKQIERKSKENNITLKSTILNMSHDLRTPLTSIQGYLQLIEMDEVDENKKKEYIRIVESRINTLKSMMENFFELAKVESNAFTIEWEVLNVSELFIDVLGLYYGSFQDKGIDVDLDLKENLFMIGDQKALTRIFNNLISNIVIHHATKAQMRSYSNHHQIVFVFKNDTKEINEDNVDNLFEKFYTVSQSRTKKSSGLGLAITKELVSKLHGDIKVFYENNEISFILKFEKYKNYEEKYKNRYNKQI